MKKEEIRLWVECIVSHAVSETVHRLVILDETPEETYKAINPDVDFLTDFIMNEIEHAKKEA